MADGFSYGGKLFAGLPEIATEITSIRWNGSRLFWLTVAKQRWLTRQLSSSIANHPHSVILRFRWSTPNDPHCIL